MHINWSVKRISVVRLYSFIIIAMLELLVVMESVLTPGHLQRENVHIHRVNLMIVGRTHLANDYSGDGGNLVSVLRCRI